MRKRMDQCTGAEIVEETLRHLRFDRHLAAIMASSICVPCNMPYVNNIWLPRIRSDRPPAVPEGATNLGLIGQYVEVPRGNSLHHRMLRPGSTSCSSAAPRRRPFIRASTIRRRCSPCSRCLQGSAEFVCAVAQLIEQACCRQETTGQFAVCSAFEELLECISKADNGQWAVGSVSPGLRFGPHFTILDQLEKELSAESRMSVLRQASLSGVFAW